MPSSLRGRHTRITFEALEPTEPSVRAEEWKSSSLTYVHVGRDLFQSGLREENTAQEILHQKGKIWLLPSVFFLTSIDCLWSQRVEHDNTSAFILSSFVRALRSGTTPGPDPGSVTHRLDTTALVSGMIVVVAG